MSGLIEDTAPIRSRDEGADTTTLDRVPLTAFEPDTRARGGIVVLHEARTFPPALVEFMKALAADGWLVAAPHLFHRAAGDDDVFGTPLFEDFDATVTWLLAREVPADCIGVIGFDDAGTAAALVATDRTVGAAVSVAAPGIVEPLTADARALIDAAPSLKAPWLALYGRDDARTPVDHVVRLQDAVGKASVATLVVSYAGVEHRADEESAPYDGSGNSVGDDAIDDAQRRIFDWFDSHLR
ncbi:carboxymethylenebutenolidase [Rhodococcus sp. Leaf7]|uniref:dienelactone hydrolase family protein n=1 Tax=unclassified Rhodococcus (in: high G+C Gram-positive bacteria) TaxID=192944 RepID=UPI000701BE04|nr:MULTISPECIES: dienelactone hydrolase family protein [unclassified Rhodococcus (in: high G+C Gram-positive bacteria)]KQU07628.1 carboxymethylenebutenolidase [Rhodococcus sp. Leaf7]KQU43148.1 carboxymethylenebutenolidase [Rhodococcus sp. Leaf247]